MAPKKEFTNQRLKKKAHPFTRYLRDKATDDKSIVSIEEYPIRKVVELRLSLPRVTNATHPGQSPSPT